MHARQQQLARLAAAPVGGWLDRTERQLRFAYLNGQRRDASAAVGSIVQAEFERRCVRRKAWQQGLMALLEEHGGGELLRQIEGAELRRGVLRLEVSEPALRSALALRWQQRLLELVRIELPGTGIHTVRFVVGRYTQVRD